MMTYHALMYLACKQMMIEFKQLQRKKWARQPLMKYAQGLNNPWTYCAQELTTPD
jgi:hypothetical protein